MLLEKLLDGFLFCFIASLTCAQIKSLILFRQVDGYLAIIKEIAGKKTLSKPILPL